jgi:Carboxypeptidase regulatory-like domain
VEGVSKFHPRAAQSIFTAILLSGAFAAAEFVVVEPNPEIVGPHLRLTVSLHGRPLKNVELDFYNSQDELKLVRVSNADGIVKPPQLRPGIYRIEARLENNMVSNAFVKVVEGSKTHRFTMDVTPEFDAHQASLEAAEKLPIAVSVKEFAGAIFDAGNEPIPNADIRVVRRGMEFANKVVVRLKSDAEGHFSAQLEPGEYIAFFSEAGFKTKIVPFAVTNEGEDVLRVVLDIGAVTQNVMVSANEIH